MVNLDKLYALLGNDRALVLKFLQLFKTNIPTQLIQLREAFEASRFDEVSIIAHTIKSQVEYLDLEEISILAGKVQVLSENNKKKELNIELISQLEKSLNFVISEGLTI